MASLRIVRRQERARRRLLDSREDVVRIDGKRLPARWLREHMAYDPGPPRLSTYKAQPREPVDPWLLDRIAAWTASRSGR